jgi:hypothetical protein
LKITDGTKYLELWAKTGEDYLERCYADESVYNAAGPYLELIDDDSVVDECIIPIYWGAQLKDLAMEPFASPITLEIWQHPDVGTGLIVKNGSATGKSATCYTFDPSDWSTTADVQILGGGWWTEPEKVILTKQFAKDNAYYYDSPADPKTNKFNYYNNRKALLIGDCDPTFGKVDATSAFRYTENFNRSDDPNLGSYWDIISQSDAGWNIISNKAVCVVKGWERWDAVPNIAYCTITGTARVNHVGGKIGFFIGMDWDMASASFVDAYCGLLSVDGGGTAKLQIDRFTKSGGSQARSSAVYSSSNFSSYGLGDAVTLSVSIRPNGTSATTIHCECTYGVDAYECHGATDIKMKPGAFGILGETANASSTVSFDDVSASPYGINIKITPW